MNKETEKTDIYGKYRDAKGRFTEGNPGKPKGSISVISKIKQILQEIGKTMDGKERERLETLARNIVHMAINERDKDMIKLIVQYVDGLPTQPIEDRTPEKKPMMISLLEGLDGEKRKQFIELFMEAYRRNRNIRGDISGELADDDNGGDL